MQNRKNIFNVDVMELHVYLRESKLLIAVEHVGLFLDSSMSKNSTMPYQKETPIIPNKRQTTRLTEQVSSPPSLVLLVRHVHPESSLVLRPGAPRGHGRIQDQEQGADPASGVPLRDRHAGD